MSSLTPSPSWDNVPQLEEITVARAGPGGPMNTQAQALLNRIEYLSQNALRMVRLRATSLTFYYPSAGGVLPSSITLITDVNGSISGTATFTVIAGTATLSGTGLTRTLAASDLATDYATIQVTVGTYSDTITISKVRDGSPGSPGSPGGPGSPGSPGIRGSRQFYLSGFSSWSSSAATAAAAVDGGPVLADSVTQYSSGWAQTRFWDGSSWLTLAQVVDGNMLVNGTVGAAAFVANLMQSDNALTRNLTVRDGSGNVLTVNNDLVSVGDSNLLAYSSFERWNTSPSPRPLGWGSYVNAATGVGTVTLSQSAGPLGLFGTHYVRVTANSAQSGVFSHFGVYTNDDFDGSTGGVVEWVPGQTYVISFYARAVSGMTGRNMYAAVRNYAWSSYEVIENPGLTSSWQRYSFRVVVSTTSLQLGDNGELFITWDSLGGSLAAGATFDVCAPKAALGRVTTGWVACERDSRNTNISLTLNSNGTASVTGGPSVSGAVTIGGLGYTGDLNATNGATWGTNVFGRPGELTDGRITTAINSSGVLISRAAPGALAAPSATGLYLGSDFFGYWNSTAGAWKSYMDNSGRFYLAGSGANGLQWDGANLNINGGGVFSGALSAATGTFAGALSAATGTFVGTLQVGTAARSGSTMTGSGAQFNGSDGTGVFGDATNNLTYDGVAMRMNGAWVTAANLSLGTFTATLSGTYGKSGASLTGAQSWGPISVSVSGGTSPYTYAWSTAPVSNDLNNADWVAISGSTTGSSVNMAGFLNTTTPQSVVVMLLCTVTDSKGRTATVQHTSSLTRI